MGTKVSCDAISDPGHGWLKVPHKLLQTWGIADKITSYSYQRGDYAYLEEDCDLTLFMERAKELGVTVKQRLRSADRPSRVRNYESYRSPSVT